MNGELVCVGVIAEAQCDGCWCDSRFRVYGYFPIHHRMVRTAEGASSDNQPQSVQYPSWRGCLTARRRGRIYIRELVSTALLANGQVFTGLRDKKYSHIKLDKPPIRQTVHPLASADIVSRPGRKQTLHACDGDEITVDVEARVSYLIYVRKRREADSISGNTTVEVDILEIVEHTLREYHGTYYYWSTEDHGSRPLGIVFIFRSLRKNFRLLTQYRGWQWMCQETTCLAV